MFGGYLKMEEWWREKSSKGALRYYRDNFKCSSEDFECLKKHTKGQTVMFNEEYVKHGGVDSEGIIKIWPIVH